LCELLRSTGVAGRPEEHFCDEESFWSAYWGVTRFADHMRAAVAEGSTPNGVFGTKVMWDYFGYLLDNLAALPTNRGRSLSDRALLERAFPNLRYVWIRREDVIAQAVSWARAIQTNQWSTNDQAHTDRRPRFDFAQIQALVHKATEHQLAWKCWFDAHGIEPFRISYEELVADMQVVTRQVLAFLGVNLPDAQIEPEGGKQADALNARWAGRYRELAGGSWVSAR
jgi:LPS sulfotransferase NodH